MLSNLAVENVTGIVTYLGVAVYICNRVFVFLGEGEFTRRSILRLGISMSREHDFIFASSPSEWNNWLEIRLMMP